MRTEWQCTTRLFKDQWIKCLDGTCNMQISDGTIPGLYLRYYAKSKKISFYLGCRNVIDRQHRVQLDSSSRIKEIKVKTGVNNMITVGLKHKNNGTTNIIFADGTIISVLGQNITVSYNGMALAFDNREIFATTYIDPKTALQQQTQNLQR